MTEVCIIGIGIHKFGRTEGKTGRQQGAHAVREALKDAGLEWADMQFAFGGSAASGNADSLVNELGLTDELVGVGHRVVHGGSKFSGSMAITPEVIAKVEECIPLGPLHNPPNLVGIKLAQELWAEQ